MRLVDWEHPEKNDFALAEEVTLKGGYERRPDLVLYLNGLAVGVIELKRSSVEVSDGVRQLITNQEEIFNKPFFSTAQLLFAGSVPSRVWGRAPQVDTEDQPGDARAGAGRMERRSGERGPGTERAVSAAGAKPQRHPRIVRTRQESAELLMADV